MIDNSAQKKFIFTQANYEGRCDGFKSKAYPEFSLQRLSVYVETKKELDKKLRDIPGGNGELINKLYQNLDEAIMDELCLANTFKG